MALYVVSLVLAILAAQGVERFERREGRRLALAGLGIGGFLALMGLSGALGGLAESYTRTHADWRGQGLAPPSAAALDAIRWGAIGSAAALAAVAGLALAFLGRRVPVGAFSWLLCLLIGTDFWRNGHTFWNWVRPEQDLLAEDQIVRTMRAAPLPFRVHDPLGVYPSNTLLAHGLPQVLGYHGNQIRTYDELWGRQGDEYRYVGSPQLWELLAARFVVLPDTATLSGYHRVSGPVATAAGYSAVLLEADTVPPYARVVSAAVKIPAEQIVPTLLNPRLDFDALVLFDSAQDVTPVPLTALPPPSTARATVTQWQPGRITLKLDPVPAADSYVLLAENWYPDWRATVGGRVAKVLRGNHTLLTVPVSAGASVIELEFRSRAYLVGRVVTLLSLLALFLWAGAPWAMRRWQLRRA
jgi:hypothetical protein